MKKKYSLKIFLYAVLGGTILASGCAISAFSFAWFSNNNNVSRGFDGSTTGAYFARGNGSEENPYVINKPIHLYNLAWLQYVGFFKDKEPYFIIERDLDMSGWTLPPIGTTENPFLGHLDGNDTAHSEGQTATAKISNLTISNSFEKYNGRHPSSQTLSTFSSPEITGLFGVLGNKTSTVEPSVKNLYLNKISIDSATNNALSGVVAGYVNGALSNILINDSSLNLKNGTNKLTGYNSISSYASVGYCEPNYRTTYVKNNTTMYEPQYVGNASFNPTSGSGGEDQGWGGSIDFSSLSRRITNMVNNLKLSANSDTSYPTYSETISENGETRLKFNANIFNSPFKYDWQFVRTEYVSGSDKLIYAALNPGTYLPLNIDLNPTGYNSLEDYYKTNTSEKALNTNTGYIVSGINENGSATPRVTLNVTNKAIKYSIGSQDRGITLKDETIFDKSNFSFFYCNTLEDVPSTKRIADSDYKSSNFSSYTSATQQVTLDDIGVQKEEYDSIKAQFCEGLRQATPQKSWEKGYINLNGLQFYRFSYAPTLVDCKNITLNNKTYGSYKFYNSGINFSLSSPGKVKMIVGAYTNDDTQNFPKIFEITENNQLNTINSVYETNKGVITYNSGNQNDLKINLSKLYSLASNNKYCLNKNHAYYVEIPLNKGNYYFSAYAQENKCPYILYLDIGANAGGTAGRKVDRTKVYELLEQINEGFTYPTGVAIVDFDNAVDDLKKFTITIGSTYSGSVTFNYSGNNNAQIKVDASNSDTGLAYFDENMRINNGTITDSQVHGTITNTETQRLTYFDYDKETKITNVLTFSQTRESSTSAWGETKREDYQSGESNTTFVGVGNLTIYGDDGKSTTDLPEFVDYKINKDTNVFKLKMLTPLESPLEANWLPLGKIETKEDAANYYFTLTGYDFTLKKGTEALSSSDYSVTKNADYALSINGTAI